MRLALATLVAVTVCGISTRATGADGSAVKKDVSIAIKVTGSVAASHPTKSTKPAVVKVTEPSSVETAVAEGKSIVSLFKNGKYREVVAGVIMILLFVWRRYASKLVIGKLSSWWLTFLALLLGYIGTVPEALAQTPFSWWGFVWKGLLTGSEAIAFWLLLGKKAFPKLLGDIPDKQPADKVG